MALSTQFVQPTSNAVYQFASSNTRATSPLDLTAGADAATLWSGVLYATNAATVISVLLPTGATLEAAAPVSLSINQAWACSLKKSGTAGTVTLIFTGNTGITMYGPGAASTGIVSTSARLQFTRTGVNTYDVVISDGRGPPAPISTTASSQALATFSAGTGQTAQALTMTAANFVNGVLTLTGTAQTVGLQLTPPTGSALDTQLGTPSVGTSFPFIINNQCGAFVSFIGSTGVTWSTSGPVQVQGGASGGIVFKVTKIDTGVYVCTAPFICATASIPTPGSNVTLTPQQLINGAFISVSGNCQITMPLGVDMDAVSGAPLVGTLFPTTCLFNPTPGFTNSLQSNTGFAVALPGASGVPKTWLMQVIKVAANTFRTIMVYTG